MSVRLESAAWLRRDRWRAIPDHRDDSGTGRNGCGKLGDRRAIWIAAKTVSQAEALIA